MNNINIKTTLGERKVFKPAEITKIHHFQLDYRERKKLKRVI